MQTVQSLNADDVKKIGTWRLQFQYIIYHVGLQILQQTNNEMKHTLFS